MAELLRLPRPVECRVVARLNRFVVEVKVGGKRALAHLNNTGRLRELLVSGRRCYCLPKRGGVTRYKLLAVEEEKGAALVDTAVQMKAFEKAVESGLLPWAPCRIAARAPKLGSSRLDYLLECCSGEVYVEVKSAVMRVNGRYAAYPDCPSARGRRHIVELTEYAKRGGKGLIVFVAALPQVEAFKPSEQGDPEIPRLLALAADAGVMVKAVAMHYEPAESVVTLDDPSLPVLLPRCS